MMKKTFFLFAAGMLMSFSLQGFAEDTSIGNEFPSLFRGVRPLGMGNAFLSMPGTDYSAQFYNPAAINDFEKKAHFDVISPSAESNTGIFNAIQDVVNLKNDLNSASTDAEKTNVFRQFTDARTGDFHHVSTALPLFHIRNKYFSAGLLTDTRATIALRDQTFSNVEVKARGDAGMIAGSAYGFLEDTLQVGSNVKVLYRAALEERVTTGDVLAQSLGDTFKWSNWKKGIGVGVDLGAKYQLPLWQEILRPTVAISLQDIADTRFSGGAPKTPMSISAGGGIFPKLGDIEFAILVDFREINQKVDLLKKFHAGAEVKFPKFAGMVLSLRGGANQGYPAAGLSLDWPIVALHAAYFGEEIGEYTHAKANYRFAAQLAFNW
ncbi:MAG: hypothetical protein HY540_06285 [Deltaproteobacteria bacterium]|nr:hypothetical protein [Deltaproteobacteria bacterium]